MKKIILCIIFLFLANICFTQDYKKDFREALLKQDTTIQLSILREWEKNQPDDADIYISYLNYYFTKAKKEVIEITSGNSEEEIPLTKDSTENTVGYLGAKVSYDKAILQKGMDKIDKGISLHPNRLDMRLGKIFTLGKIKSWNLFTDEITKTIQHSSQNKNSWLWLNNEPLPEAKEVMLASIQRYQQQLYETGNDELLNNMQQIAQEVLAHYPNHVASLSNLAITHIFRKNYDEALEYLHKAERLNPNDGIVLANMAKVYELKEDLLTSKVYYQKIAENPDIDVNLRQFAKDKIQSFNKK
ncbi:tetratricopeptide repeat protein [Balneicella halophila]|uniref:Tetratricopeptide repeat protein n=1 Tax=Balneicella halophila TaxID=1537566 RepID=A0A7L4UN77_BALHA|nr:tetratricopeptide repeat protein [Balneicella halophila]PVX49398.1 tetratricopeptide repeat protein [Balneicella halophila]